jgi:hypothetical protein
MFLAIHGFCLSYGMARAYYWKLAAWHSRSELPLPSNKYNAPVPALVPGFSWKSHAFTGGGGACCFRNLAL